MHLLLNIAAVFFTISWTAVLSTPATHPNHKKLSRTPRRMVEDPCSVQAWVRAEDLSPSAIANGELRIKVNPACTEEISSVALQLQLDEFGQVRSLKADATLPTPPGNGNVSVPLDQWNQMYMFGTLGDSDHVKYYESLRDPAFWVLKAEERTAFKVVVTLIEKYFDYALPIVVPFVVATPNVNYPPGLATDSTGNGCAYRYTALISFASGRKANIPAGYTTFLPRHAAIPPGPFSSNVTFMEPTTGHKRDRFDECASDTNKTVFEAQIMLEGGNIVRAGDTVKGRIAIHHLINGSTTANDVSLWIRSERHNHWAKAQANSRGDIGGVFPGGAFFNREITTSSCQYGLVFGDETKCSRDWNLSLYRSVLSEEKQYLEFEVKISEDTMRSFRTYYVSYEASLVIKLCVAYPPVVECCMVRDSAQELIESVNRYEEELWDKLIPVRQPHKAQDCITAQTLEAKIPITLIGTQHSDAGRLSTSLPIHYLAPDATSPLILTASPQDVVFPLSQPVITREPIENTTLRLLSPPNRSRHPPSFRDYTSDTYAGLLWKKKIMLEDMVPQ